MRKRTETKKSAWCVLGRARLPVLSEDYSSGGQSGREVGRGAMLLLGQQIGKGRSWSESHP